MGLKEIFKATKTTFSEWKSDLNDIKKSIPEMGESISSLSKETGKGKIASTITFVKALHGLAKGMN